MVGENSPPPLRNLMNVQEKILVLFWCSIIPKGKPNNKNNFIFHNSNVILNFLSREKET